MRNDCLVKNLYTSPLKNDHKMNFSYKISISVKRKIIMDIEFYFIKSSFCDLLYFFLKLHIDPY